MLLESLRHAVRALRHDWRTVDHRHRACSPLTIGAVMAIFAIVDAVLLRPLPVRRPGARRR